MTDLIPNSEPRTITIAQGGDDDKTGDSTTFAIATLGEAVNRINNLVPVPTLTNPAAIEGYGAGSFSDSAELIDFVQIVAPSSRFVNADPDYTIKLNDFCAIESTVVWNVGAGDSILFDNCSVSAAYQRVVRTSGGGAAFKVTGTTNAVLLQANQVRTLGGTAVDVNSTIGEPLIIDIDDIVLTVDNDVAFDFTAIGGKVTGKIGSITSIGTTGTQAIFRSGQIILQGDQLSVDTVVVKNGAEVWLNDYIIEADIVVEAGGILHCRIYQGDGYTIVNNGEINGDINGVRYGSFVIDDDLIFTFAEDRNFTSSDRLLGVFRIDTTDTTINDAVAFYNQNVGDSREATFEIVDASDYSTAYYTGSNSETGTSPPAKSLTLSATGTPLPTNQPVNLAVIYRRSSGVGNFSLSNPSIIIGATKT
jgi:hypothetical protein